MSWSERASRRRKVHALAIFRIFRVASSALALACCAPGQKPATSSEDSALDAQTSKAAFAQLNAVQRHADTLPNALAVHDYLVTRHQQSGGLTRDFLGQVLAASDAELGDYERAVREFSQGPMALRGKAGDLPDAGTFHASDAADAVATLARDRRIVMVNEAHHIGETRLLTLALLPRLREEGFTHVAVEGLDEHDRDLVARGYPTKASGPYIREPLYGEIVRIALRLGFIVVPYESTRADADLDGREEDQARHILERVFRGRDDARLLVHAGYAHVHKRADYLDADTLAMRLKRMTGFDPLSIDQTILRPISPAREHPAYRELQQRFVVSTPAVLLRPDHSAWSLEPDFYDVSVILPPTNLVNGRPDWLALGGERIATPIGLDLQPASLPCVVEARYASEGDAAVPADRALVERADIPTVLFLRPGEYRVAAFTSSGRVFGVQRLRVAAEDSSSSRVHDQ
jgi:hypothetical protein